MNKEEERIQVSIASWFRMQYPKLAPLMTLGSFGEAIGKIRGRRLNQMGYTKGHPDLKFSIVRRINPHSPIVCPGLYIEVKTEEGRVMKHQREIQDLLRLQGYRVCVCRSFEEAMKEINDYLS